MGYQPQTFAHFVVNSFTKKQVHNEQMETDMGRLVFLDCDPGAVSRWVPNYVFKWSEMNMRLSRDDVKLLYERISKRDVCMVCEKRRKLFKDIDERAKCYECIVHGESK